MKITDIVSTDSVLAQWGHGDYAGRGAVALLDDTREGHKHGMAAMVIWRMAGEVRSPKCEARVHMIAASDDMLLALHEAFDLITRRWGYPDDASSRASVLIHISRAIAKAEGLKGKAS